MAVFMLLRYGWFVLDLGLGLGLSKAFIVSSVGLSVLRIRSIQARSSKYSYAYFRGRSCFLHLPKTSTVAHEADQNPSYPHPEPCTLNLRRDPRANKSHDGSNSLTT